MKEKLDTILKAFGDFIRESKYFDIVYSEKIGYVILHAPDPSIDVPEVLTTPKRLLDILFNEIINDVMFSPDNPLKEHKCLLLTEYEETESRRRIAGILETMEEEDKVRYLDFMGNYFKEYQESYRI